MALGRESAGTWLLVVNNAEDMDLLFDSSRLSDYLPFNRVGSILFTTRNHQAVVKPDIPQWGIVTTTEMSRTAAVKLLKESQGISDARRRKHDELGRDFGRSAPGH